MPFKIKKTVSNITIIGNSVYFTGASQYLSTPTNVAFDPGNTGAWTLECWFYLLNTANGRIVEIGNGGAWGGALSIYRENTGKFGFFQSNGSSSSVWGVSTASTYAINNWYHLAVSKDSSNNIKCFINGIEDTTMRQTNVTATVPTNNSLRVNAANDNNGGQGSNGYVSNVRWIKGTALYTASFSVPTAPLTAITNTQLLTCNAATIIDGSTNNFTITNNGTATVSSAVTPFGSTFSPFKIKKNDVNLTSGFKLKQVSYVRPVYDFTISPAYSGKSTWDLTADGPLILSTSGSWIITPANLINTKIKMWGGGGASFKAAWKGGGGGFSSGSVQLEPGVPYRIVTSMNGSNGIIGSGGLTGIFSSSISQANSIMIAGGGGIGTDYIGSYGGDGGAGGGSSGQDGTGNGLQNGRGGTQIAGGSPAIYNGVPAGSALQANGGDGGAGYWGGGAQNAAGSGGGSGYIHPTKVVNGTTVTGASSTPANSSDSERSGSAQGSLGNTPGSMGIIIIRAA